jgi:hypothetical protein
MLQSRYWVIGLLLMAVGCGTAPQPSTTPAPQNESGGYPVRIHNQNFSDMNIYVVNGGQHWLLGTAGGLTETTLEIPRGVASVDGQVRLEAEPIGSSQTIFTPVLVVAPGQSVYWTIGSDPAMSSASTG